MAGIVDWNAIRAKGFSRRVALHFKSVSHEFFSHESAAMAADGFVNG
jgi:hypothetical protein